MADYRTLGKLLKYEYQLAPLAGGSKQIDAVAKKLRLGIDTLALPAFAAVSTDGAVLGILDATGMTAEERFSTVAVREFLEQHKAAPVDARKVLADGLAAAQKTGRHVFVYLSAPW